MASLISSAEKAVFKQVFEDLHDTWSDQIVVYKTPNRVVASSDTSFNFIYDSEGSNNTTYEYTPVSGVFDARILYADKQELQYANNGPSNEQMRMSQTLGECRIKVRQDCFDFIKEYQSIEFNGNKFSLKCHDRPHGLFEKGQFFTFYLTREN